MAEGVDEIFVLDQSGTLLRSIPARPMHKGLFDTRLEDALQKLLETPGIIPGTQIDPVNPDPPRFALLRREMPIGGWSLDHLYVDQTGMLTLIEAKLLQNPESRREVIGQIVEYAANAKDAWSAGMAKHHATEYWSKRNKSLDDMLRGVFPLLDLDQLWRNVESNLESGVIRLIIAADSIRPEVRRMIEYLNSEMKNVEVLGLELRVYAGAQGHGDIILAPRIIGQTQAGPPSPNGKGSFWNAARLREAYGKLPDQEAIPLIDLLDWAVKNDCFLGSRAISPTFGLAGKGKAGDRIFSVSSSGILYLQFEEYKYPNGRAERDQLLFDLKQMRLVDRDLDPETVVAGRNLSRSLSDLYQSHEFDSLLELLGRYCRTSDESP